MPLAMSTRLAGRHSKLLVALALFVALLIVAGEPVAAESVSDPIGDIYIGP